MWGVARWGREHLLTAHRLQSITELLHLVLGPLDATPLPVPVPPLRVSRLCSRASLSTRHTDA